jgi:hypothetical protein
LPDQVFKEIADKLYALETKQRSEIPSAIAFRKDSSAYIYEGFMNDMKQILFNRAMAVH